MMLGCMPLGVFATESSTEFTLPAPGPECFEYTLNADKTAVITKYSGNNSFVAIPDMIDGYKVVSVGSGVFKDHKEIRQLAYQNNGQNDGQNLQRIAGLDCRCGTSDCRRAAGLLIRGGTFIRDAGSVFCKTGAAAFAAE